MFTRKRAPILLTVTGSLGLLMEICRTASFNGAADAVGGEQGLGDPALEEPADTGRCRWRQWQLSRWAGIARGPEVQ
jgi:hypothetical protein